MRNAILEGLLGADILGFQTHDDVLNFIRTCQQYLQELARSTRHNVYGTATMRHMCVPFRYPLTCKACGAYRDLSEVAQLRAEIEEMIGDRQLILRIERIEPSKNIVRGFQAFKEMLTLYPEY